MILRTCLFRRLHLTSKSFRIILLISLLLTLLFTAVGMGEGLEIGKALPLGILKGFGVFLSWVFARELDPDSKVEAFYGLLPLAAVLFFYDDFLILPCFFILCCMRIVTRSAGQEPSLTDYLFLLFFSVFIYFTQSFIFLLFGGIYILVDSRSKGGRAMGLPFAFFMILIGVLSFMNLYTVEKMDMELVPTLFAGLITAMFAYRLSTLRQVFSMDDTSSYYLSPKRIKDAGTITLMFTIMIAVNTGYMIQIAPLWFAMLGVSFPYLRNISRERKAMNSDY